MWLPAIAQVLPGSLMLHLRRDPRDLALSHSMAAIRPTGVLGWVSSLDQIRAVLSIHLQLTSLAIERLQLNHRVIRYESLVAQPEASLRGCLDAMHLPMHEGVLHPERNPRIPITLSHSQAREPIYSTSVGRWRQYDWLFGGEWEPNSTGLAISGSPPIRARRAHGSFSSGGAALGLDGVRESPARSNRRQPRGSTSRCRLAPGGRVSSGLLRTCTR